MDWIQRLDAERGASVRCSRRPTRWTRIRWSSSWCWPPTSSSSGATSTAAGKTVIAGYHWFNDWGRDTMISLPGLTLTTGRAEDAAVILRTFARYVDQGMLPNNFPDTAGALPGYNTVDATLWYVLAIAAYEHDDRRCQPGRRAAAGCCARSSSGTCAARATASASIRPTACCARASRACS